MLLLLFGVADAVVVGVVAAVTAEKLMDYVRSVAVSCVAAAFLICDQRRRLEDRPLRCTTYVQAQYWETDPIRYTMYVLAKYILGERPLYAVQHV